MTNFKLIYLQFFQMQTLPRSRTFNFSSFLSKIRNAFLQSNRKYHCLYKYIKYFEICWKNILCLTWQIKVTLYSSSKVYPMYLKIFLGCVFLELFTSASKTLPNFNIYALILGIGTNGTSCNNNAYNVYKHNVIVSKSKQMYPK